MKVSKRVLELETGTVGSMLGCSQFTKGHNYIKSIGRVMIFILFTSSDDVLYLYQVSRKYLEWSQSYWVDIVCIPKFTKGHNAVKL